MYVWVMSGLMMISQRWIYAQQVVYDENFFAELYKLKAPKDDVHLADGVGFMVSQERYQAHLKAAIEIKQVCTFG